jgi:hypothetical protein
MIQMHKFAQNATLGNINQISKQRLVSLAFLEPIPMSLAHLNVSIAPSTFFPTFQNKPLASNVNLEKLLMKKVLVVSLATEEKQVHCVPNVYLENFVLEVIKILQHVIYVMQENINRTRVKLRASLVSQECTKVSKVKLRASNATSILLPMKRCNVRVIYVALVSLQTKRGAPHVGCALEELPALVVRNVLLGSFVLVQMLKL